MKTHILLGRVTFTVALLAATTLPFSISSEPGRLPAGPEDCLPKDPPPPTVKLKVRVPANSEPGQPL
ncbi:MAG: hypothetical protein FJ303_12560, partial [Planctomycetes bacterium]|nr:hypothetical protein [Planctomycetota bacterium]